MAGILLVLCTVVSGTVIPPLNLAAGTANAESVTDSFNKARKLFEQGKLRSSYKILSGLAKKYPDHQPTQILLGRILFKIGKISAAAKRFRKIGPDEISGDFAYEYGIVMFTAKQCERAQAGFARVPANSKLAPLANFYRGVCYVRSQDWQRASKYLNRAKGLPGNLEQTRRQALSQVVKQLRAERSGSIGSTNPYIIVPTPPPPLPYQPYTPEGAAPVPPDNKPPPPPPPPPTGFQNSFTPAFVYTQTSRTDDFHGTGAKDSQLKKSELKFGFKTKYLAAPRSFGAQPFFSLGFDLNQVALATKGSQVKYIAYENDPGTLVEQQTAADDTSTNYAEVRVAPEIGYPVTSAIDLAGGFTIKEKFPEMKQDKKSSTEGPFGSLSYNGESFGIKGTGSVTDTKAEGKTVKTDTVTAAQITKEFESTSVLASYQTTDAKGAEPPLAGPMPAAAFRGTTTVIVANGTKTWETFSMTAGVTDTTYDTGSPLVIKLGEDKRTVLELSGNKSFDFGGSLTVTIQQATLTGYKNTFPDKTAAPEADPKPIVYTKAEATEQTVLTVFKMSPLPWLTGSLSYKYINASYTQSNAEYQKDFIQVVPDLSTEFTMVLSLSKTF